MSYFSDPKLWLAVAFTIFLILVIRYVLPLILKNIDLRIKSISDSIDDAKKKLAIANKFLSEAEKMHELAIKDSEQLLLDANNEAQSLVIRAGEIIEEEINKKIEATNDRITKEEEKIIRDLKSQIVSSTIESIEKKIINLSTSKDPENLTEAIKNISNRIH